MAENLSDSDDDAPIEEISSNERFTRTGEKLGVGSFKTVYKGFDRDLGIDVAWNQLCLQRAHVNYNVVCSEIDMLKSLDHENILKCYDSWYDEAKHEVVFITEWMSSGSLKTYYVDRMRKLPRKKQNVKPIRTWCKQILAGVAYLHSQEPPVIHRDIKCDNIFIDGTNGTIKIGDLGLARTTEAGVAGMSIKGTPEYMAPDFYDDLGTYTELVDIWAFGMAVIEMVTLEFPYTGDVPGQILLKVLNNELPPELELIEDEVLRHLVGACLQPEKNRPSAAQLLMHPFFKDGEEGEIGAPRAASNPTVRDPAVSELSLGQEYASSSPSVVVSETPAHGIVSPRPANAPGHLPMPMVLNTAQGATGAQARKRYPSAHSPRHYSAGDITRVQDRGQRLPMAMAGQATQQQQPTAQQQAAQPQQAGHLAGPTSSLAGMASAIPQSPPPQRSMVAAGLKSPPAERRTTSPRSPSSPPMIRSPKPLRRSQAPLERPAGYEEFRVESQIISRNLIGFVLFLDKVGDGHAEKIDFEVDISSETAESVTTEMLQDLEMPMSLHGFLCSLIQNAIAEKRPLMDHMPE